MSGVTGGDRSALLTYGAPFVGALLIAVGIIGGLLGGYAVVQQDLGLCGDPTIVVYPPDISADLTTGPDAPDLRRFDFAGLSPAEQRAFERAVDEQNGESDVRGAFPNRAAFREGAVVTYRGTPRYATLVSTGSCLSVDPLLFPLGVVSILLGIAGVLTPPAYRRALARERRG